MRTSRILIVLSLVLALLLTTAAGIYAQTPDPDGKPEPKARAVRGVVVAKSAKSFEIKKADGERLTVQVVPQTKFRMAGRPDFGFKDLQRGDGVSVLGKMDKNGGMAARLVNVAPRKARTIRVAGTVTHADHNRITIDTIKGDSVTLTINDKTRFVPADAKPKKGDKVAAVAVKVPGEDGLVAKVIAVRKPPAADKS